VWAEACGICHSDAFVKDGTFPGIRYPAVPGHEVAGRIDAAQALKEMGRTRVILATASSSKAMTAVIDGLGVDGRLLVVGATADPIEVTPLQLIGRRASIAGWPSGTAVESEGTMRFSALTGVRPMTETYPLERAAEGYERMISGAARFHVVLLPRTG
jgi:D-arabinose 1-dehydrogenase-like Zn-dependent alcohol dehydrogenase